MSSFADFPLLSSVGWHKSSTRRMEKFFGKISCNIKYFSLSRLLLSHFIFYSILVEKDTQVEAANFLGRLQGSENKPSVSKYFSSFNENVKKFSSLFPFSSSHLVWFFLSHIYQANQIEWIYWNLFSVSICDVLDPTLSDDLDSRRESKKIGSKEIFEKHSFCNWKGKVMVAKHLAMTLFFVTIASPLAESAPNRLYRSTFTLALISKVSGA